MRSFHGKHLSTVTSGEAALGFDNALVRYINEVRPVVVFDYIGQLDWLVLVLRTKLSSYTGFECVTCHPLFTGRNGVTSSKRTRHPNKNRRRAVSPLRDIELQAKVPRSVI